MTKSNLFKKTLNTRYFGRKSSFYESKEVNPALVALQMKDKLLSLKQ